MPQPSDQSSHAVPKPLRRGRARISQTDKDSIQKIRNKHLNTSLDDNSHVSEKVRRLRLRVWNEWEDYTGVSEIDGEQVWRQLCEGVPSATQELCSFLEYYIVTLTKLVPSLGPDEYEEERTVQKVLEKSPGGFLVKVRWKDSWQMLESMDEGSLKEEARRQLEERFGI